MCCVCSEGALASIPVVGLGFRVWGLGFRVWGLAYRVLSVPKENDNAAAPRKKHTRFIHTYAYTHIHTQIHRRRGSFPSTHTSTSFSMKMTQKSPVISGSFAERDSI